MERPNIRVVVPGGTAEDFERAASRLGRAFFIASDVPFPEQIRIEALFGAGALAVRAEATATPASRLGQPGAIIRLDRLEPGSLEISIATEVTTELPEALVEVRLARGTKPMAHVVRRQTPQSTSAESDPSDDFEAGMVTKASNVPAALAEDLKDFEEDLETHIPPPPPIEASDPPRATAAIIRRATPSASHVAQAPIFKPEEPAPDHLTTETVAFAAPSELLKPDVEEVPAKPDPSMFKPPQSLDDAWATAETIAVIVDPSTIAGAVPDAPLPPLNPAAAVDKSSDAAFRDVSSTTSTIVFESSAGSSTIVVDDPAALDSAFVDNPSSTVVIDDPAALDVSTGVLRPAADPTPSKPPRTTPPALPPVSSKPAPPAPPSMLVITGSPSMSSEASPSPAFDATATDPNKGGVVLAAPTEEASAGTHDRAVAVELKNAARFEPTFSRRSKTLLSILAAAVFAAVVVVVLINRGEGNPSPDAAEIHHHLSTAARRIAGGQLMGPGGDAALDHLLAAKQLAPKDPKVAAQLQALADTFEKLGDDAATADELVEAIAHFQAAVRADPDRASAKTKLAETEQRARTR